RARQMPPAGRRRPDEDTYIAVLSQLETALDRAAAARPNPGRPRVEGTLASPAPPSAIRRLTRTEYQNAIRDLLALSIDATALLPADEAGHGFDTVTARELSPTLLNRYISAAQKISRLAVGSA